MKKLVYSILTACLLLCAQWARAQGSIAYFYNDDQNGYTIDALPGTTNFIASGTIYDPSGIGNSMIHLVHYDQNGNLLNSYTVDLPSWDDRSVKVIGLSATTFAVICYAQSLLGVLQGEVRILIMDISGTMLAQQRYAVSSAVNYRSLYPLDAIFDRANRQFAICGTAANGSAHVPASQKVAFVLTVDAASLAVNSMMTYNTIAGNYGIATKIKKTNSGSYFLTGSENIIKMGNNAMCIRNMLINPATLNILVSSPLTLSALTAASENSVDMFESSGAYCLLVNSQQANTWGIVRVDKTLLSPLGNLERSPNTIGLAYAFLQGNGAADEAVVAGMLDPSAPNAIPFLSFLDFSTTPGTVYQEVEYSTAIGNNGFWTLGNFYAGANGYPLPSYLHKFACRINNAANNNIGLVAPILSPPLSPPTHLNSKFIPTSPLGKSPCPLSASRGSLILSLAVNINGFTTATPQLAAVQTSTMNIAKYKPTGSDTCTPPYNYYKLNAGNSQDASGTFYPNPVNSTLHLNLSAYGNSNMHVQLLDLTGKHIANIYEGPAQTGIEYQIPAGLAKGLYLLSIEAQGMDRRVEKISIQ